MLQLNMFHSENLILTAIEYGFLLMNCGNHILIIENNDKLILCLFYYEHIFPKQDVRISQMAYDICHKKRACFVTSLMYARAFKSKCYF